MICILQHYENKRPLIVGSVLLVTGCHLVHPIWLIHAVIQRQFLLISIGNKPKNPVYYYRAFFQEPIDKNTLIFYLPVLLVVILARKSYD